MSIREKAVRYMLLGLWGMMFFGGNAVSAAVLPPGAAAEGYTRRLFDERPSVADITDEKTGPHKWFSGQWYRPEPAPLDRYFMTNDVLALLPGGDLVSAPRDMKGAGGLPLLAGDEGFYVEFDVWLSDRDPDHFPAVWLMPIEHNGRKDDHFANDPPGFERFMELDVDEGGFGPGLTCTTHSSEGVWSAEKEKSYKHIQNPGNILKTPLDRTKKHTFGAGYNPRTQTVTWWLDGVRQLSATKPFVPETAAHHHYYLLISCQQHAARKPYTMFVGGVRAFGPPVRNPDTDWMSRGKVGAFAHFLFEEEGLRKTEDFDVTALADQLAESGVAWFGLTLGQNSGFYLAPNETYEKKAGYAPNTRCSKRDIPLELGRELKKRGIRLVLYLPCQTPNRDAKAVAAFGLEGIKGDRKMTPAFFKEWAEVIETWSVRYGDLVSGWWFDGGYAWCHFDESAAALYKAAVKKGNPHAIVTFNPGVSLKRARAADDYTAGEINDPFEQRETGRWLSGAQRLVFTFLGHTWGGSGLRYSDSEWIEWIRHVTSDGAAVMLDVKPDQPQGTINEKVFRQLKQVVRTVRNGPARPRERLALEIETAAFTGARKAENAFARAAGLRSWSMMTEDRSGHAYLMRANAKKLRPDETKRRGEIWTEAIQSVIDRLGTVYLPARKEPYLIDAPLLLGSGQSVIAAPDAVIRLCPGTGTCMIRNRRPEPERNGVIAETPRDNAILIDGGIWDHVFDGNASAASDRSASLPGAQGVFLIDHAENLYIRNITLLRARAYAVHLFDVRNFVVENIRFENNKRDGVHVNGHSSYGVIRQIYGETGDDFIALNAWEWSGCGPGFGPIDHILVEDIHGTDRASANVLSPYPDYTAEIRLLPGTKTYADGHKEACPIQNCVLRRLENIRTVKAYDQPNIRNTNDCCHPIGLLKDLYFADLTYRHPGLLQVATHVDGLEIDGVRIEFPMEEDFRLCRVGPMSYTHGDTNRDPSTWIDLFSPNSDLTVRGLRVHNVSIKAPNGSVRTLTDAETARLIEVRDQQLNPRYPQTRPRGGTGRVNWIRD